MRRKIIQTSLSAIIATALFAAPAAALVRATVGQPLVQAVRLFKAGDYTGATAWVDKASAVSNKTAEEQAVIDKLKQAIRTKSFVGLGSLKPNPQP